jgi:hypothetical protein
LAFIGASLPALAMREAEVKPGRYQSAYSMNHCGELDPPSSRAWQV